MTYDCCMDQWAWSDAEKSPLASSLCNLSTSTVKTKHTISSAPSKHPDVFSPTSHSDFIWSWSRSSATHRGVGLSVYCLSQSVSQLWPSRELGVGVRGETKKTTIKSIFECDTILSRDVGQMKHLAGICVGCKQRGGCSHTPLIYRTLLRAVRN